MFTLCTRRGKGTCFAYGQTGSGKTYTMQASGKDCMHMLSMRLGLASGHHRRFTVPASRQDIVECILQPLPLRAARDIFDVLALPDYQGMALSVRYACRATTGVLPDANHALSMVEACLAAALKFMEARCSTW